MQESAESAGRAVPNYKWTVDTLGHLGAMAWSLATQPGAEVWAGKFPELLQNRWELKQC